MCIKKEKGRVHSFGLGREGLLGRRKENEKEKEKGKKKEGEMEGKGVPKMGRGRVGNERVGE